MVVCSLYFVVTKFHAAVSGDSPQTGVKPLQNRYLTGIGSSSVKTDMRIIITSTADELISGTNIDDLERT